MRQVDRLVLRSFLPIVTISLSFFVLIIQLVDLFANLVRYLNAEVPLTLIATVQLLYLPKAISYALPISLLFAVAFAVGSLYANNELIAVFSAGVSLRRFVLPLLIVGALASVGSFFFEERVVIDSYARKNELSRRLLSVTQSMSNTNVTVRGLGGTHVYAADYYNDLNQELSNVVVIERSPTGTLVRRIDATVARWGDGHWVFENAVVYDQPPELRSRSVDVLRDPAFNAPPRSFQRTVRNVDELRFEDAREWVRSLQSSGLPYRGPLTDYYKRFAFAGTSFVVTLVSASLGGRFRKNVLLMSLLVSIVAAVVYYVSGMIGGLMATGGILPPLVGAWFGVALFTLIGVGLFASARN